MILALSLPVSNGSFLFVSVRINPAAKPGDYLLIETAQGGTIVPFHLNAPLDTGRNFQGIRLAMNIKSGWNLETPRVVAARYLNLSRKR